MRKYIPHFIAALLAVAVAILGFAVFELKNDLADAKQVIDSQQAQIIGHKNNLQKANDKIGLAESDLVAKDAIIKQYRKDIEDLNIKIGGLEHGRQPTPTSRDSGTVVVDGRAKGSGGIVRIDPKPPEEPLSREKPTAEQERTAYYWSDNYGRFRLDDPDIYNPGDEIFTYKLKVRINGYILEDPTGKIRGRQVIARELIEKKNPDGTVTVEEGPPLQIEDNIYQYSLPRPEKKLADIFRLRGYALFDSSLNPGVGVELFNIGNYFDYVNIGAGPFISIEVSGFPNSLQSSLLGIGAQYTLVPPIISTNIGIGLGVSTPADNLFGRFQVTGNIIFYLTN